MTPENYVVRHWHDELSLPWSYWINGGAVTVATDRQAHDQRRQVRWKD